MRLFGVMRNFVLEICCTVGITGLYNDQNFKNSSNGVGERCDMLNTRVFKGTRDVYVFSEGVCVF